MKIAIAQINPIVGDLKNNTDKIISYIKKAEKDNADLIVFPELSVVGYPPRDLIFKELFVDDNLKQLERIRNESEKVGVVVGHIDKKDDFLFNSISFFHNKKLITQHNKILLPTYDVFDETRYFESGDKCEVVEFKGEKISLQVCEDLWDEGYERKITSEQSKLGADIIINISASPFFTQKYHLRETLLKNQSKNNNVSIVYVNQVGANDDIIFDGRSMIVDKNGKLKVRCAAFKEDYVVYDTFNGEDLKDSVEEKSAEIYEALVLGIRDYFYKQGFSKAVIGLSGGIDSAVTVVLAVEALGKENVLTIGMPSKFSSEGSVSDSEMLAENLDIKFEIVPIKDMYDTFIGKLSPFFKGTNFDTTEENLQSRIRGNLLMAFSNKFGYLVLNTGNKSEMAVGYCTLYGDMNGGLGVLSDVYKEEVYNLSRYINKKAGKEIVPIAIIEKPPSAELRPDQKDQDSLPPYEILDKIIELYIEHKKSRDYIIKQGIDKDVLNKVIRLIDNSEYKRRQAPLGLKITEKAFGSGRRMPIVQKYTQNETTRT